MTSLELRLLRYFLAVVDEGTVTGAAATLRVAQPSISRQVRQLEEIVGAALFERRQGRLRLSPAGAAFLPLARDLVRRADYAENVLRDTEGGVRELSLAAPETTVTDVIAPFLAQRGERGATVTVREAIPSDVFGLVLDGRADLGISSGPPPGELHSRQVHRFAILAYVRPGHPLAAREEISLEQLVQYPLIVLGAGHGTRRVFDDAVGQAGLVYSTATETNVPHVAQAMAAAGRGVAVVTDDRRYGLRPLLIELDGGPLTITLFAAWSAEHFAEAAIVELVDDLASFVSRRYSVRTKAQRA